MLRRLHVAHGARRRRRTGTGRARRSARAVAPGGLHLDGRQVEEILLTSAQSLFGIAVLANLRLSLREAMMLFVLFAAQLFFPDPAVRYGFSAVYLVLGVSMLLHRRNHLLEL